MFEKLHSIGYVYNDLKEDNICVGKPKEQNPDTLKLIDFGLCTKYLNESGEHIDQKESQKFRGNVLFCSPNQMNFESTSRRDDVISLFYFLVYLTT